jgi:2-(1,2-epoxy-1,2-dihydrophenyl)acetyl-CoA isomerase
MATGPHKHYPNAPDGLAVEHDGPVLRLTLDRPARRNAITDDIVLALIDLFEAAGSDDSVRVILLASSSEHFCSGFDLGLRGGAADGERPRTGATQRHLRWHVNRLIPTMLETQTPIVAAVRGYAIGLGLHLALACDFCVTADDARLREPFTTIGFTPDSGGSWLIPRLAGVARAKEMLLLGHEVSGAQAAEWGMVHRAVPAAEVDATTEALVQELASAATVAVGLAKLLVHHAMTSSLDAHLAEEALALELASRSDDFHETSRARRAKRPPDFTGR